MKKIFMAVVLLLVVTGLFAQEWPALTKDAWESMTVELLNEYLGNNDVNVWDDHAGKTALMWASTDNSNPEVIQALIDNGADVNAGCAEVGSTALMYASANNSPEVIQVLIDNGADINARNFFKDTPLMWAASGNSNPEVIKLLIDNGADVHARDKYGQTALTSALRHNSNPEVIQVLKDNRATEY